MQRCVFSVGSSLGGNKRGKKRYARRRGMEGEDTKSMMFKIWYRFILSKCVAKKIFDMVLMNVTSLGIKGEVADLQ